MTKDEPETALEYLKKADEMLSKILTSKDERYSSS
jgi:hypothetical protein